MSCRPAVGMPNMRQYIVRRLDSQEQEVNLQKKATGGECLDRVCKTLGILERDYFGLRYVDKNGEYLWINLRNPLHEQLVPGNRPVMEMRVKYFVKPQKLLQPVTRYHFYKQLKRDLLHGKLKVGTSVKAARLTALIAQIDKGDYRVGFQYQHKVMCQATESDNMDARIRREHQKIAGTSVEMATEKFLEEVSMLELYGVELYHVLNNHRVPQVIGVGPENVQVYSRSMELQKRFSYSSVQYTAFHAKKFTALVASSSNNSGGSRAEQMDFELKSRAASQALYRTITEFHTFFRRESVSSVVKTAGFCKSLLGNFKGQDPDRFYFDVMKTHREVVDHVWSILHPSTTLLHDNSDVDQATHHSQLNSSPANSRPTTPSSTRRNHTTSSDSNSPSRSHTPHHHHHHHHHHHRDHSSSGGSRRGSQQSITSPTHSTTSSMAGDDDIPPPLPPPARHMQRAASNMHRSHSVQESDIRHAILQRLPPLPPYSQRSCSSDALMRASNGRRSQRSMLNHGPHMASTATFNPYISPSISETESDLDESMYASGGSDCYVAMSTQSEPTYFPSSRSDASGSSIMTASSDATNSSSIHHHQLHNVAQVHPARPGSDTSGIPSDTYITSGDSECSNGSFRAHSPPPLYTEVDPENTVSINFGNDSTSSPSSSSINPSLPNSGSLSLVSPIIPVPAGSSSNGAVFNFDAAAVLTRTRELEGELQRLRSAMTCRLCKQNPIGATFCPCGHTVCCFQCAQRLRTCWECDQRVASVQRMLLAR